MSKSRGNTISPDDYISEYGSDVFRLYLGFGFAYTEGGPWNDDGVKAIVKFVSRIEKLVEDSSSADASGSSDPAKFTRLEKDLQYARHYAIRGVTTDAEKFQFNTSISRMMELLNALNKYQQSGRPDQVFVREVVKDLVMLIAPFAPHFAEEMWEKLGYENSIFTSKWPAFDEQALIRDTIEIAVQINGQVKFRINIPSDADNQQVQDMVTSDENYEAYLAGRNLVKFIYVKGRLANLVVK
jgi:leucyl-tRNA synthetase